MVIRNNIIFNIYHHLVQQNMIVIQYISRLFHAELVWFCKKSWIFRANFIIVVFNIW